MRVRNVHERVLPGDAAKVGALLDSLSDRDDRLWPMRDWPPMRFDRPLQVGAVGGHGPIRYTVVEYEPGRRVRFRFTGPEGFDGYHEYEVVGADRAGLRHSLLMSTHGRARLSWPVVFRPLHDALIEDSLHRAATTLGESSTARAGWSPSVRLLRWALGGHRSGSAA